MDEVRPLVGQCFVFCVFFITLHHVTKFVKCSYTELASSTNKMLTVGNDCFETVGWVIGMTSSL